MIEQKRERVSAGRRRFPIRPAYIILVLIMGFFAYKFVEKTRELQQLNREAAVLRSANQQTLSENHRLQRDITYYHTEAYVEEQARATLGYEKPGDTPIITTPRYLKAPVAQDAAYRAVPSRPTWQEWWDSFFH